MRIVRFEQFVILNKNARRIAFVSGLGLAAMVFSLLVPRICSANDANAEAGEPTASETSLTISSTNDIAVLDVTPVSEAKSFGVSDANSTAAFSVTTNNYTGYTLSIAASDDEGKLTNVDLTDNSTHYLDSIESSLNASAFNNAAYVNKWGFKPNRYVDNNVVVDNTGEYAVFLPSPTITYTIALGVRVNDSTYPGSYTSTMELIALANMVNYTINFDKNTEDVVTNMPAAIGGATDSTSVSLPNNTPERTYYFFRGWCTVVTTNSACSGNTFQPSADFGIDQTSANSVTLYAIWEAKPYMQDYDYAALLEILPNAEDSATLYDKRDDKAYTVTRLADGNIWMTSNLDLAGGTELTSALSNMKSNYTLPESSNTSGFISNSDESVYNSNSTECSGNSPCYSYYTYAAATAGTNPSAGDATSDICPKGWRLPKNTEFEELINEYGEQLATTPWGEVFTGEYYGSALQQGGFHGSYWSSTANGDKAHSFYSQMYREQFASIGHYYSVPTNNKYWGFQIRCIVNVQYIQDYDQDDLAAALPNAGDTIDLYDKRDGNKYTIGKLADGNYWMLDNLRLDLVSVSESKLQGNTNASDSTIDYLKGNTTGTANDRYATSAVSYVPTGEDDDKTSFSDPYIDVTVIDDTTSAGYTIGTYYNYCAATAGSYCFGDGYDFGEPSGNATEDICPSGWRLPTGGDNGEFAELYNAYSNDRSALVSAAHLSLSGFNNGAPANINSNGGFWSSNYQNFMNMKVLYLTTSAVSQTATDRKVGYPVRCIFNIKTYLQDLTTADYDELIPNSGNTMTAYDRRDDAKYTIGRLADGNVWMLENLRLDPTTVSADVLKGNTNASDTAIDYLKGTNTGTTSDRYALAAVSTNWPADSDSYAVPYINTSEKNTASGVYYNLCAASAGTYCFGDGTTVKTYGTDDSTNNPANAYGEAYGDVEEDICPSGWHLPTGGQKSDYERLIKSYSSTSDLLNVFGGMSDGHIQDGIKRGTSYLWTTTDYLGSNMISVSMLVGSNTFLYASATGRQQGINIRCVANEYMQDVTFDDVMGELNKEGYFTTLFDKRDGKPYRVTNDDGVIWMTTNLNLAGGTELTPALSNVASNYTLPASSLNGFDDDTKAFVYNSGNTNCGKDEACYSYYSYIAATAGTNPEEGDSSYDICPKGWRMPSKEEFEELTTTHPTLSELHESAWNGTFAGYIIGSSHYHGNDVLEYWSSTATILGNDAPGAYYLYGYTANTTTPIWEMNKRYGVPVRCVMKDTRTYMQDVSYADLATILPNAGDTATLFDKRDGEAYTVGRLADGNYWLLENLRLDPVTVSLAKLKGNTNATDTSLTYLKNGGGTSNYAAVGVINDASAFSFTNPQVHTGDKNVMQTSTIEDGQTWQNKLGVYYNFCAATAGSYCYANTPADDTPDPTEDLCPSGWHMPRGNGYDGDALTLRNSFATDQNINLKAALKTTLGGYYSEGEGVIKNNGAHGYIWESMWVRKTSTRSDAYDIFVTGGSTNSVVLSSSQAANVYSVRCVADKPEPAKTYIQDVTIETCPTEPTIVYDRRDEEEYTIQKLADNRCWLLDNLRLDLIAVSADALKGNTNASDTTINYLKNGGGNDEDKYATSGVTNWTSSYSYSVPLFSVTNKNTTGTGGYAAGKYGVYYNYCAASAGSYCYGYDTTQGKSSGDATEDICPAGWRMPTGNSSGEYKTLYTAYNSDYNTFVNALRTPLPGRFYNGSVSDLGSVGVFWSSTRSSNGYMYNLEVQTSSVDSQDYIRRQDGHSVRCILKD